ncbi:mitochondrial ribosomal protein L23 [Brevipalpus obovatus]|uniref:mitochondrial ribosomal protein L23 n=1 Tax=Brevipalpus obovatus TaxID=246614 RepID=UPI003D9EF975
MSSRYYPMWVKGNPQLRIYLPNFYMKMIPANKNDVPNKVVFKVPVQMTDWDVKNYLEKIYKVPVKQVVSRIMCGKIEPAPGKKYLIKSTEDYREASVYLPEDQPFVFPNINPEKKAKETTREEKSFRKTMDRDNIVNKHENWDRKDVPSWFRL